MPDKDPLFSMHKDGFEALKGKVLVIYEMPVGDQLLKVHSSLVKRCHNSLA